MDSIDVPSRILIINKKENNYILKVYKGWYTKIPLKFAYKGYDIIYIRDDLVMLNYYEEKLKIEVWNFTSNEKVNSIEIEDSDNVKMIYDKERNIVYIANETDLILYNVSNNKFNINKLKGTAPGFFYILSRGGEYLFIGGFRNVSRIDVLSLEVKELLTLKDRGNYINMIPNEDRSFFIYSYRIKDSHTLTLFDSNSGIILHSITLKARKIKIYEENGKFYVIVHRDNRVCLYIINIVDNNMVCELLKTKDIILSDIEDHMDASFISKDLIIIDSNKIWNIKDNSIITNVNTYYNFIIDKSNILVGDPVEDIDDQEMNYYTLIGGEFIRKGSGFKCRCALHLNTDKSDAEKIHKIINSSLLIYINTNIRKLIVNLIVGK